MRRKKIFTIDVPMCVSKFDVEVYRKSDNTIEIRYPDNGLRFGDSVAFTYSDEDCLEVGGKPYEHLGIVCGMDYINEVFRVDIMCIPDLIIKNTPILTIDDSHVRRLKALDDEEKIYSIHSYLKKEGWKIDYKKKVISNTDMSLSATQAAGIEYVEVDEIPECSSDADEIEPIS